jgi:opacity protein-like surface antigen
MKTLKCTLLILFTLALPAFAQKRNIEVGGGYAYASGNGGLNGFNVDAALLFGRRVAFALDYDGVYDTSNLGTFEATQVGQIVSKNHLQDFVLGPRFYFPGLFKSKNKQVNILRPFAEVQLGGSHLSSSVRQVSTDTTTETSDSAFTWLFGGGADYRLSSHWVARGKIDLLRTHFANSGQSRVRFVLGFAYTLKARK